MLTPDERRKMDPLVNLPPARRLWSLGLWSQYRCRLIGPDQVEAGWDSDPPNEFVEAVVGLTVDARVVPGDLSR